MKKLARLCAFTFFFFIFSFLTGAPAALAVQIGASSVLPTATSTAVGLELGLVGYWTMDGKDINWTGASAGTIIDRSGNGNTGTLVGLGRATSTVAGKLGQAMKFDGVRTYINVPKTINFEQGITMCAWSYPQVYATNANNPDWNARVIVDGALSETGETKDLHILAIGGQQSNATVNWNSNIPAGNRATVSGNNVLLNKWSYLCMTANDGKLKIYQNGAYENSSTYTDTGTRSIGNLKIGKFSQTVLGGYFNGLIDDVRIYNRALTAAEVKQLYQLGQPKVAASAQPPAYQYRPGGAKATSTGTGLNKGLVGYWTMDGKDINWTGASAGTIIDRSGNGNTGTLVGLGRATSTVAGKLGQAMKLDGLNSYIKVLKNSSNFNSVTLEAWILPKAIRNNQSIISSSHEPGYLLRLDSNKLTFFANTSVASPGTSQVFSYIAGKWLHIVVTHTNFGQITKFYVNGLDLSNTSHATNFSNAANYFIGGWGSTPVQWFLNGQVDDVRIYNRALSAQEVKQLYDMGAGNKTNLAPAPPNTQNGQATAATSTYTGLNKGLVGYWTMDGKDINWTGASAGTIIDRSGNGNTGTLVGLGRATSTVAGKLGQAFMFNNTSSYISVADKSSLSFTNNKFAFSFWATNIGSNDAILQKVLSNEDGPWEYAIFRTSTGPGASTPYGKLMQFSIWTNGGNSVYSNWVNPPADRKWHHWVWSADGQVASVYLDGVFATSSLRVSDNSSFNGTAALTIGRGGGSNYWGSLKYRNGPIDDLRIYNRALTAAEVKQLYNMGR